MKNTKHIIASFISVASITALSAKQTGDIRKSNRIAAILNRNVEVKTKIEPLTVKLSDSEIDEHLNSQYTEEELSLAKKEKSILKDNYILLTNGVLSVYETPSTESRITGTLNSCDTVKITESTDNWYKISDIKGLSGYVDKKHVTASKEEAEYAAMHYDNYKKARIKTNGANVNIRSKASSQSAVISQLQNGSEIILQYDENGYTKVYFGSDMSPGYIASDCIELTNEWIQKSRVTEIQKAAEERKAAEARAKVEAKATAQAKSSASKIKALPASPKQQTNKNTSKGQMILNNAKKHLGVKYVYGGTTPNGFDCSGLVQYVCRAVGIQVNRTAAAQFGNGKAVNRKDLQPGDLLFFAKNGRIHHVGIYAGNGQMIHAPQTGDVVKYSSINTAYRKKEYVGARRVY